MLPMLDAADPNDRALKSVTICVCVVSVGYLVHNPHIVTRMVELSVIIVEFFIFIDRLVAHCAGCLGGGCYGGRRTTAAAMVEWCMV